MNEGKFNTLIATSICSSIILLLILVVFGYQQSTQSVLLREIRKELEELEGRVPNAGNSEALALMANPGLTSSLAPTPQAPTPSVAETEESVAALAAKEQEIADLRAEMDATLQENKRLQKEAELAGANAALANPKPGMPKFSQPEILKANVVAFVEEYHPDYGFCVIKPGAEAGIVIENRYAIRQGQEIVGMVKITKSESDHAIGELVPNSGPADKKPEAGNHLIEIPASS